MDFNNYSYESILSDAVKVKPRIKKPTSEVIEFLI